MDDVTAAIKELRKSLKESNDEIVSMFREWRTENAAILSKVQADAEKSRATLEGRISVLEKDKSFRDGTDTVKVNIENRRPKWASTAVSFVSLLLALAIAAGSLVITFVTLRGN